MHDGALWSWRCLDLPAKVVNEFLVLLFLCVWLLRYLLDCLNIDHEFSHFYSLILSLILWVGESKGLHGDWLLAGVKPKRNYL